jgi:hypothetical protein
MSARGSARGLLDCVRGEGGPGERGKGWGFSGPGFLPFLFFLFSISFLFQTPLKLFEFK